MAAYFHLNDKFNMILDNQGRLVLSDQCITSPHSEPERSPGFAPPQNAIANSSREFGLEETSLALSRSSSNSTFDSGDNKATSAFSLQFSSKEFDRETFLTELRKSLST